MKIKIKFFEDNLVKAIGAGVYEIKIKKGEKSKTLYVGESVFVLVRCATHLFRLKNKPGYFGFDDISLDDSDITLEFKLINSEGVEMTDKENRKKLEIKSIQEKKPILQRENSDRVVSDKKEVVKKIFKKYD